jgi:hypothetical protein
VGLNADIVGLSFYASANRSNEEDKSKGNLKEN